MDTIQLIRNVYMIYLYSEDAKIMACEKGIELNNIHVDVYASNPFLPGSQLKDANGISIPHFIVLSFRYCTKPLPRI